MSVTTLARTTKLAAARGIARSLTPAENAIDTCIVENARLIISIIDGRRDAGVAAEVGHDAYLSAAASMIALRDARDHAVRCHQQLADVRDALSMAPSDVGCTVTKRSARARTSPDIAAA